MEGRAKRNRGGGTDAKSNALAELRALRAGKSALSNIGDSEGVKARRINRLNVKVEDDVYDVVDDEKYADIVARRAEMGDFVVDDNGLGYEDMGQEEEWDRYDERYSSDDGAGDGRPRKKGKVADPKVAAKKAAEAEAKRAAEKQLAEKAAALSRQRMTSMFAAAAGGKPGSTSFSKAASGIAAAADQVLDDVLLNITADDTDRERERRRRRPGGVMAFAGSPAAMPAVVRNFTSPTGMPDVKMRVAETHLTLSPRPPRVSPTGTPPPVKTEPVDEPMPAPADDGPAEQPEAPTHDGDHGLPSVDDAMDAEDVETPKFGRMVAPPEVDREVSKVLDLEPGLAIAPAKAEEGAPDVDDAKKPALVGLNAKIEETTRVETAMAGWQAVCPMATDGDGCAPGVKAKPEAEENEVPMSLDDRPLPLDTDGTLPFFFLDAFEETYGGMPGSVFLFGKVPMESDFVSCCLVVKNMERCLFAVPHEDVFADPKLAELEVKAKSGESIDRQRLNAKLRELSADMRQELAALMFQRDISNFSIMPVKRSYAFERTEVPAGEGYFLKITYSFKDPPLPMDLKGQRFTALFGTHTSALELLLIKRKMMGPLWLAISNPQRILESSQVSWCKLEVHVGTSKDVNVAIVGENRPARDVPPVVVAALNLKTVINHRQNVNEIAAASVVYCKKVKVDGPTRKDEWNTRDKLGHFSAVRRLDGGIFPPGFTAEVQKQNTKAGGSFLTQCVSERSLLIFLVAKLQQLDADVLVGHNISGFDLDVLLHRLQAQKVPHWSRIGRLKRTQMPRLGGGGGTYGSGASPGAVVAIAGRLLCDTYLSSRELLKEVSYTLTQLARSQLNEERIELAPSDVPKMFDTSTDLIRLTKMAESDAWLALGLMFHLSVLPLTRQLTNLSGNLWSKTLQGARAQRIEYLLLHEFHARKFVVPDKLTAREKEQAAAAATAGKGKGVPKNSKGGVKSEITPDDAHTEEEMEPMLDDPAAGGEGEVVSGKRKKGPAYAGGLVLEPKKGLYDKYVLLLDFNSLYPSIIQEYNICFTTIARSFEGPIPPLPDATEPGVLPSVIRKLVERRRQVKAMMKNEGNAVKRQQLDIRQQALKLTANSMYGCLGFSNSRFYARPLAELITFQGREILQSTVDLVQNTLNLEVIYGDTDSIMIHTGLDDLAEVRAVGVRVKKEVNKRYRLLEIEMDGIFKRMLLLKKKKYASIKLEANADGSWREVMEQKGLDIVRRDWSILSKDIGNYCLDQILSGSSREDVVDALHGELRRLREEMDAGQVPLEKYVITKGLTRAPEEYPDAKAQPHVQVALRRKQSGRRDGCSAGDTIPFIICMDKEAVGVPVGGIAARAYHIDEVREDNGQKLKIDIDYYLQQQVHPVVARLCAPIEGTDAARIADCLGLDASKYHRQTAAAANPIEDAALASKASLDDDDRYLECDPLELDCPRCLQQFVFPGVSVIAAGNLSPLQTPSHVPVTPISRGPEAATPSTPTAGSPLASSGTPASPSTPVPQLVPVDALRCPHCLSEDLPGNIPPVVSPEMLSNQVRLRIEHHVAKYYDGVMLCEDEMCRCETRNISLRAVGGAIGKGMVCPNYPQCSGHLIRQYTEASLYKQLCHFWRLLDVPHTLEKIRDVGQRGLAERRCSAIRKAVDMAAQTVQDIRERSAYRWIKLDSLFA